jgi:bidirectional [NiFe] hydrogenase diaphorase subunit
MNPVTIFIDGQEIKANEGEFLLFRALAEGIFIPNLCAIEGLDPPPGSCRLCYVEIEGYRKPVTSCTVRITEGMKVTTRSEAVDRLVRAGFELMMSVHRLNCKHCPGNKRCDLQTIAKTRKVPLKPRRVPKIEPDFPIDESRPEMGFDPNHCVLCGKCVYVCNEVVKKGVLDIANRGLSTTVSTFDGLPLADQDCGDCTECALTCPVGALYLRTESS